MRYRSKPAEIDAEQFDMAAAETAGVYPSGVFVDPSNTNPEERYYVVTAHKQRAFLQDGVYVVTEPDGRGHYPVQPDIFERRWEPIPETAVGQAPVERLMPHVHDIYAALGVEWGGDPFTAIAALRAGSPR